MAEKSIFWTTGATGDGATAYTQAEVIRWMRQMWLADTAEEGVMKGYENELEATGTATPVAVNTGAALIYGFPYWNTASVNVAIPTPAASTRIDRIVLRAGWAAQTVRITRIAGTEGAGAPAITQTDGVTWDLKICQASITTGGIITITDDRDWARPNIGVDENMLDASVAGDALSGGDGSALDVVPGTNLEISSDTIRIAASAAGDGLQGGGASVLAVDVSDFAGTGLEDDGSENLRIAAAAAGDGLSGGAGSALDVNASTYMEIVGDALRLKSTIAGAGLAGGGAAALSVGVDGTIVGINGSDQVYIVDDSILSTKIGWAIPVLEQRRGGSASAWEVPGTSTYTLGIPIDIQVGTKTISDSGTPTVSFAHVFANIPIVIAIAQSGFAYLVTVDNITVSQFETKVWNTSGARVSEIIMWMAIGERT